jgi:hypothetical protein
MLAVLLDMVQKLRTTVQADISKVACGGQIFRSSAAGLSGAARQLELLSGRARPFDTFCMVFASTRDDNSDALLGSVEGKWEA